MAETHEEIVKVWIEDGCIVCDACESDSPEVFEVLEETCIIRPAAAAAAFTQALTPSIIIAAEGCPTDVIKYETITVEGPEPWADEEEEATAGAGAGGGGGAKKKAGWEPPQGPPDPLWAGLLSAAHTSSHKKDEASDGSVEEDVADAGTEVASPAAPIAAPTFARTATAPVEAIVGSLDASAPADAVEAVAVGAGFAKPAPTMADRIRTKAAGTSASASSSRRQFSIALAVAWGSMAGVAAVVAGAIQSFIIPKVSKEPPSTFRAGKLGDFSEAGVYEQHKPNNVWIIHLPEGKLVALSTICTHLGCIPNWLPNDQKYKCPCHGSGFYMDGVNFEGPAPRPLERLKIYLKGDIVMVDKSKSYREELGQWASGDSFVEV
jgi:cytochrome b6-f complex iron-sulfur subunit